MTENKPQINPTTCLGPALDAAHAPGNSSSERAKQQIKKIGIYWVDALATAPNPPIAQTRNCDQVEPRWRCNEPPNSLPPTHEVESGTRRNATEPSRFQDCRKITIANRKKNREFS
ncbi:hypothetical protein [Novipirellula artificiosorum]|uniref:hypothetical protein n=1 Tax=Novipirellula artificiosorum TaxID=2528016 RepID=UPI0011B3E506|nr:hypothetical protein [Novipirellula artificiosorum]